MSIITAPLYIRSEAGIADLIVNSEKYILGRNRSITVLDSELTYIRNINITLKVSEWDICAAGKWNALPPGLIKKFYSILNIQNTDQKCFAYCIAAYILRRDAAARRVGEPPPAVPADIAFCQVVTQQQNYEAVVSRNASASR